MWKGRLTTRCGKNERIRDLEVGRLGVREWCEANGALEGERRLLDNTPREA